jgi:hypothetical protein
MIIRKPSSIQPSKEFAMARSIQPYFVTRAAQADGSDLPMVLSGRKSGMYRSRSLAGMLLAAAVTSLMVVADQLIDTWADGHLLAVWVALWTAAFTAMALLAPPLRQITDSAAARLGLWTAARAQKRSDNAIWALAQQDYRVMSDLQAVGMREEADA